VARFFAKLEHWAIWILSAKDPRIPTDLSPILLAAIIIIDFSAFDIVFRDVSILLMAIALIALHTPHLYKQHKTARIQPDQLETNQ